MVTALRLLWLLVTALRLLWLLAATESAGGIHAAAADSEARCLGRRDDPEGVQAGANAFVSRLVVVVAAGQDVYSLAAVQDLLKGELVDLRPVLVPHVREAKRRLKADHRPAGEHAAELLRRRYADRHTAALR